MLGARAVEAVAAQHRHGSRGIPSARPVGRPQVVLAEIEIGRCVFGRTLHLERAAQAASAPPARQADDAQRQPSGTAIVYHAVD